MIGSNGLLDGCKSHPFIFLIKHKVTIKFNSFATMSTIPMGRHPSPVSPPSTSTQCQSDLDLNVTAVQEAQAPAYPASSNTIQYNPSTNCNMAAYSLSLMTMTSRSTRGLFNLEPASPPSDPASLLPLRLPQCCSRRDGSLLTSPSHTEKRHLARTGPCCEDPSAGPLHVPGTPALRLGGECRAVGARLQGERGDAGCCSERGGP